MEDVHIIGSCRTPIGSFNGCFSKVPATTLGSIVIKQCLERGNICADEVNEVIMGQVLTAGQGQNPARQSSIKAGISNKVPAYTVNMICGSGLKAISNAYNTIKVGDASIIIAGGQENMSMAEHSIHMRKGHKLGSTEMKDTLISDGLTDAFVGCHMGVTAEHLAESFEKNREAQDAYAYESQMKTKTALENNYFTPEIVPVISGSQKIDVDEHPKPATVRDELAKLKTVFKRNGSVTAGNASGINDGAAAVLLCSGGELKRLNLKSEALIIATAQVGTDPILMGLAPIKAITNVLEKAKWTLDEVDLFELNEAFAVQSLLVVEKLNLDVNKVNICGGAIALGHPIGASGARVLVTLLHNMKRLNKTKGIAALCIGGGMGIAIAIQRQ